MKPLPPNYKSSSCMMIYVCLFYVELSFLCIRTITMYVKSKDIQRDERATGLGPANNNNNINREKNF